MSDKLTLADLVDGLTQLGDYLTRFDVFADDVGDLDTEGERRTKQPLSQLDSSGRRYVFEHNGNAFELVISDQGTVRVTRSAAAKPTTNSGLDDGVVDAAVRAANAKKGAGWPEGLILGMGFGRPIGAVGPEPRPKRIFTTRFDTATGTWSGYDGGLVPWLKSEFDRTG